MKLLQSDVAYKDHLKFTAIVTIAITCLFLLISCDLLGGYDRYSGINHVEPKQYPPFNRLIWSHSDPNKILVSASAVGSELTPLDSEVYILDTSTGEKKVIASTDSGIISVESWSFDEEKVILNIDSSTEGYEDRHGLSIWSAKSNTLEFLAEKGKAIWSPDGKKIAVFDSSSDSQEQVLRIIDVNTKHEETQVIGNINDIGYIWGADWSPDGNHIVLSIGGTESSTSIDLYIYDTIAHNLVKITQNGNNFDPVWASQGDKIAYIKQMKGSLSDSIHIINSDGSCDIELPYIDQVLSISWLPDDKSLGFISPDGVYILDLDIFMSEYINSNTCL